MKLIARFIASEKYEEDSEQAELMGKEQPDMEDYLEDMELDVKKDSICSFNQASHENYWRIFTDFGVEFHINKKSISKKELEEICQ